MRVALVNCAALPEPDPDEAPGLAAFRDRGHDAQTLAWDDPAADPGGFDLCLLRAAWNYVHHLDRFLAWCDRAASSGRIANRPAIVRWNAHKGYLPQLERGGVPIVPTLLVPRGEGNDAPGVLAAARWDDVVVKPAVGAGSYLTRRFRAGEHAAAARFLDEHTSNRDMLVQRYMASVERSPGECAIVWIDGEVTHVVEKSPRFDGDDESVRGREACGTEVRFAERTVHAATTLLGERPMYARIDVMTDDEDRLVLSELELIEPSLYFDLGPGSADRFVRAAEAICESG